MATQFLKNTDEQSYHNHPALSKTKLSLLPKSPKDFWDAHFGDGYEITSSGFKLGTLLDILMTEPERFETEYVVRNPMDTPSSPQEKQFCQYVIEGYDPPAAYDIVYKTDKKSDEKVRKEGNAKYKKYKEFIDFQANINGEIEISQEDHTKALMMRKSILEHPFASRFFSDPTDTCKTAYQVKVLWDYTFTNTEGKEVTVQMRSMFDILQVDTELEIIEINDIKTTGKKIWAFFWEARKFDYFFQLKVYEYAVKALIREGLLPDYRIIKSLTVVESGNSHETRTFSIPEDIDRDMEAKFHGLMERYDFHVRTDEWELTMEAATNELKGLEPLVDPSM